MNEAQLGHDQHVGTKTCHLDFDPSFSCPGKQYVNLYLKVDLRAIRQRLALSLEDLHHHVGLLQRLQRLHLARLSPGHPGASHEAVQPQSSLDG